MYLLYFFLLLIISFPVSQTQKKLGCCIRYLVAIVSDSSRRMACGTRLKIYH